MFISSRQVPVLQLQKICSDSVSCKFDYEFKFAIKA